MLIFYDMENNSKGRITGMHKFPEKLTPEQVSKGIIVDNVPKPIYKRGKITVQYINPQTKEIWSEYIDRPLTFQEEAQQLKKENVSLGQQLFQTQTELLESKRENELLGQQLFNLQTALVEKGAM